MTTRQQRRLETAEAVCHLVARHHSCGLVAGVGYTPDVESALHLMQEEGERIGGLEKGSLHWLGQHARDIRRALNAWLTAVGLDPVAMDKIETKRMAMEIAKEAFGIGYEGEVEQLHDAKNAWPEKIADQRAAALAADFASGKIKGSEELRIALAAEILEAEYAARAPFVEYASQIFAAVEGWEKAPSSQERDEQLSRATTELCRHAYRWLADEVRAKIDRQLAEARA